VELLNIESVEKIRRDHEAEKEREIARHFAGPGELGLTPLLEAKRIKYGIPNSAWRGQPLFNKVLVWQIPLDESEAYGGGLILKTDRVKGKELTEAPRGVIVSAGLQALDELRSHGCDVGHTVSFTHLAPFRKFLPAIAGKEPSLVILHSGDIFDSEELAENLKTRKCRVITRENEGAIEHFFCDENGRTWNPAKDAASEDS